MEVTNSMYERYKLCDKYVITWLAATARANQCPQGLLEPVSTVSTTDMGLGSARLTGKARKEAKAQAKASPSQQCSQLKLGNLVPLAEHILNKSQAGKIRVPVSILKDLDESIRLRTTYGRMVQPTGPSTLEAQEADRRHTHFVQILTTVRQVLGRLQFATRPTSASSSGGTRSATKPTSFRQLNEIPDDSLVDDSERLEFLTTIPTNQVYTAGEELPSIEEAVFYFRLLLADYQKLEAFIMQQWEQYINAGRDIGAVAVATELALRSARDLDQQARERFLAIIQHPVAVKKCREPSSQLLEKYLNLSPTSARNMYDGNVYFVLYNLLHRHYGLPSCLYHTTFQQVTMWYKEAAFKGAVPAKDNVMTLTGDGAEYTILNELDFIGHLRVNQRGPVIDGLSRAHFADLRARTVRMSNVFGVYILININQKLEAAGQLQAPADQLQGMLKFAETAILSLPDWFAKTALRKNGSPIGNELKAMLSIVRGGFGDVFAGIEKAEKVGMRYGTAYSTFKRNPVLAGLQFHGHRRNIVNMALKLEAMIGGVMAAVHLGNAFFQEGLLGHVGNLKPVIKAQGDKAFFVGGERPGKSSEYLSSYMLAVGGSAANLLPAKGRHNPQLAARNSRKGLATPDPFTGAIHGILADKLDRDPVMSAQDLVSLMKANNLRIKENYDKGRISKETSPLEIAANLLNAEALQIKQIDYFGAVNNAWTALKAVQDRMGGPIDIGGEREAMDPSEVIVGRMFANGVVNNKERMGMLAREFGRAVGADGLVITASSSGHLTALIKQMEETGM
ncbi:hypothetical protein QBC44DRAFT_98024 [Cladorrhinum sp. PSN332]|nr:hypothetical protein QBC44DRAFT_98024 [Cladorrhinum sp. PSN332]